jgi:hypothetical protein
MNQLDMILTPLIIIVIYVAFPSSRSGLTGILFFPLKILKWMLKSCFSILLILIVFLALGMFFLKQYIPI